MARSLSLDLREPRRRSDFRRNVVAAGGSVRGERGERDPLVRSQPPEELSGSEAARRRPALGADQSAEGSDPRAD